jgi:hypothetical protein
MDPSRSESKPWAGDSSSQTQEGIRGVPRVR